VPGRRFTLIVLGLIVAMAACRGGGTDAPAAGSVDVGVLRDMADHHEQAVRMSLLVIPRDGVSPAVRDVALGIIASQRYDVGKIEAWLDDWHVGRGSPSRAAMAWMGHRGMTPAAMPGMATPSDLGALGAASGTDAEVRFLDLMAEHHRAGGELATFAATHAETGKVRRLAELIEAGQQEEILELISLRRQLETSGTLDVPRPTGG
jgi:uncharacterized protein (DUF305 family)